MLESELCWGAYALLKRIGARPFALGVFAALGVLAVLHLAGAFSTSEALAIAAGSGGVAFVLAALTLG